MGTYGLAFDYGPPLYIGVVSVARTRPSSYVITAGCMRRLRC